MYGSKYQNRKCEGCGWCSKTAKTKIEKQVQLLQPLQPVVEIATGDIVGPAWSSILDFH